MDSREAQERPVYRKRPWTFFHQTSKINLENLPMALRGSPSMGLVVPLQGGGCVQRRYLQPATRSTAPSHL